MTRSIIRTREAWLSALALFLAIQSLEALHDPPLEDIRDMRTLLRESYPTYAARLWVVP